MRASRSGFMFTEVDWKLGQHRTGGRGAAFGDVWIIGFVWDWADDGVEQEVVLQGVPRAVSSCKWIEL